MAESARILIVEDNDDLAFGLRTNLEVQGYEVAIASSGPEGLELARALDPALIVLDLMLPGLGGIYVLRSLRAAGATMPILILTAKSEEVDKVSGLRLGADDYVTKPFGLMELMARVEALLRRYGGGESGPLDVYRFGDIEVHLQARQVILADAPVDITPKEFDLLLALLRRGGAVATRLELMSEVWGHSSAVISRTVDTHVAELRRKLERVPARPKHIITVRKVGYRLVRD